MAQRVLGSLTFTNNERSGKARCTRCGIEVSVKSAPGVHLCIPCRADKWYVERVSYAAVQDHR